MRTATLLVELLTEELPPRALKRLSAGFASALAADLRQDGFTLPESRVRAFATPRRLAVLITDVLQSAPDREIELSGPSVKAGLDPSGKPTRALLGFARKQGVDVSRLERRDTPKGEVFVYRTLSRGGPIDSDLALKVEAALKKLPVPKIMRWGAGDSEFVRPAHGLMMLHGPRVVPGKVLGLESGNVTRGHRFTGAREIVLANADEYEAKLRDHGMVIADFDARRAEIGRGLEEQAARQNAELGDYQDLLDEVTALVEWPVIYVGSFDPAYLEVPQECLILTMRQNQKVFPLFDARGRLLPRFIIVSNTKAADPRAIIAGNERVVRPRLEDARFFYDQDRKMRLEARVPQLGRVVYHARLGSQLERVERLQLLAGRIAEAVGADPLLAERAAWLSKADLLTGMVGEFPELQGIMGGYYAKHDGEPEAVADAIEAHYRPRFAGDRLPESPVGCVVALAEKLEALAGMFGIGEQPSGDKDPFGLRRHAIGVVRILIERDLPLDLFRLVNAAFEVFDRSLALGHAHTNVETFIFERMRGYFAEAGYSANEIEAVLCLRPVSVHLIPKQLEAVRSFSALPEAPSLAAANKRIGNILKKASPIPSAFDPALFVESAEKALAAAFLATKARAEERFAAQDYTGALRLLASLKSPVDAFFDDVMVMTDNAKLRDNRVGLLFQLRETMNRVADISKLAA